MIKKDEFFYERGIYPDNPTTSEQNTWTGFANVEMVVCERGRMTIITELLKFLHRWFRSSITVTITLSLLLLIPAGALADSNNSDDPPPKTTGTSGGSRG
jgi:hypothetical protein